MGKSGEIPGLCRNCDGIWIFGAFGRSVHMWAIGWAWVGERSGFMSQNAVVLLFAGFLRRTGRVWIILADFSALVETVRVEPASCPGLFCPTIAQDGVLTRIRTPGGRVLRVQLETLVEIAAQIGCPEVLITNRANLQLRSAAKVDKTGLKLLQQAGLAARPEVDHLRNVMASPLAGCDSGAIANGLPVVMALDAYIAQAMHLEPLSAKFSIGVDGGESVSVRDRLNDIWLVAESAESADTFRLYLGEVRTEVVTRDCVQLVDAIARVYLAQIDRFSAVERLRRSGRARLRDVVRGMGFHRFLEAVMGEFGEIAESLANRANAICSYGDDRVYVEIIMPIGYMQLSQIRSLIQILSEFNLSEIRLTPWQTIIIPNVTKSSLLALENALMLGGLNPSKTHPARGIVACSGRSGCKAAATHAKEHALELIQRFTGVDRSVPSIHISGCEKRCAQPKDGDITLIGVEIEGRGYYEFHSRDRPEISILTTQNAIEAIYDRVTAQVLTSSSL